MISKQLMIILLILTATVAISGCTTKTATNGTFGEKSIVLNLVELSNNTTVGNYTYNGTEYYYIEGYLINKNPYDAFNVKVNSTAYDAHGNVIATNDSPNLDPVSIPSNSNSFFFVEFKDPKNSIMKYDVKVVSAAETI